MKILSPTQLVITLFMPFVIFGCLPKNDSTTASSDASNADPAPLTQQIIESGKGPRRIQRDLPKDVDIDVLNVLGNQSEVQNKAVVGDAIQAITGQMPSKVSDLFGQWHGNMLINGIKHEAQALVNEHGLVIIDVPAISAQYYLKDSAPIGSHSMSVKLSAQELEVPAIMTFSNAVFRLLSVDEASGEEGHQIGLFSRQRVFNYLSTQLLSDIKIASAEDEDRLTIYFDDAGNGAVLMGECQLGLQTFNTVAKSNVMSIRLTNDTLSDCRDYNIEGAMVGIMSIDDSNHLSVKVIDSNDGGLINLNIDLERLIAAGVAFP